jgi:hypothetical protein
LGAATPVLFVIISIAAAMIAGTVGAGTGATYSRLT